MFFMVILSVCLLHKYQLSRFLFYTVGGYHKIVIISPKLIFVERAFLVGLFSGEIIFRGAEGVLRFKMGWA